MSQDQADDCVVSLKQALYPWGESMLGSAKRPVAIGGRSVGIAVKISGSNVVGVGGGEVEYLLHEG
jgi:hypothetical protein